VNVYEKSVRISTVKQSQKSTGAVYLTTSIPPTIHPYPTDYYHQPRMCILISQSLREERVPPPLEYLNTVIVLSNAILILVKSIQSRMEISSRMSRRSRVPIFVSFIKTEDIELECVVSGWADSGFQMLARTTESSIVIRQITRFVIPREDRSFPRIFMHACFQKENHGRHSSDRI